MKNLGSFLRYARKQRGLTQEQVAEGLNIAVPVISKWENDKAVPPLDALCKLCNILSVSIEECLSGELSEGGRALPPEIYEPRKLGKTVKQLRFKNGWSQTEVGKKLFVTPQTVSKWEGGGISSLEILGKLAELFGLTPTELLSGLDRTQPLSAKPDLGRTKKSGGRILKITAIILAVLIVLGATAGLVTGLILKNGGGKTDADITRPEQPDTPDPDDGKQEEPDPPKEYTFVSPIKEFYSVDRAGHDPLTGGFKFGGMFFETAENAPVYAIADGTVISLDNKLLGDNNYLIEIEHADGFVSVYGYCADANLTVGQKVTKGQQLGKVYGRAEKRNFVLTLLLNGTKVDPFGYITGLPQPVDGKS